MTDRPAPDHAPLTDRHRSGTSLDPDHSLTRAEAAVEDTLPRPTAYDTQGAPAPGHKVHPAARLFLRGPWEMAMSLLIGLGVVMLMQPFFLAAYTWSFMVLLVGTVGFIVVSHFPEGD